MSYGKLHETIIWKIKLNLEHKIEEESVKVNEKYEKYEQNTEEL